MLPRILVTLIPNAPPKTHMGQILLIEEVRIFRNPIRIFDSHIYIKKTEGIQFLVA